MACSSECDVNLTDIKAVIYHNIEIKEQAGKLNVDIVYDVRLLSVTEIT